MTALSEPSLFISVEDAQARRQRVDARNRLYAQRKRRARLLRDGTMAIVISALAYLVLTIAVDYAGTVPQAGSRVPSGTIQTGSQ